MEDSRFDRIARLFSASAPRRQTIGALALSALAAALPGMVDGKERMTQGTKSQNGAKLNRFGCLNVGHRCKHASQCCSGRCKGKQGNRRCKAHDTGGCKALEGLCGKAGVPCTTSTGKDGDCATTTGNAGFCQDGGGCEVCTRDRDCQISGNNPTGACIVCSSCAGGTACVFA